MAGGAKESLGWTMKHWWREVNIGVKIGAEIFYAYNLTMNNCVHQNALSLKN